LKREFEREGYAGRLLPDEPLSRHTSFAIGGPADLYIAAREPEELSQFLARAREAGVPSLVLGAGTNVLVADAGVRGLVVANECREVALSAEGLLVAQSGALLRSLARLTLNQGWAGLEWAVGIPGSVGGAIVGNAGAYGGCMADTLRWVRLLDAEGVSAEVEPCALGLSYRNSAIKQEPWPRRRVLQVAALQLTPADPAELAAQAEAFTAQRKLRNPEGCCAGSVFKRTAQHPAGWLVEQTGLKGRRIGGAVVSTKHANFIMNTGHATAHDVRALIDLVQREVWKACGEQLDVEIEFVGAW
jgi:UDP-N-acetylmuramate dehydrogenase